MYNKFVLSSIAQVLFSLKLLLKVVIAISVGENQQIDTNSVLKKPTYWYIAQFSLDMYNEKILYNFSVISYGCFEEYTLNLWILVSVGRLTAVFQAVCMMGHEGYSVCLTTYMS